jgi:hypothetical protein
LDSPSAGTHGYECTPGASQRIGARAEELHRQIDRLVELYARGTVSPDVLEPKIHELEDERRALEAEAVGLGRMAAAVEAAAEFVTEGKVQEYVDPFEELATDENLGLCGSSWGASWSGSTCSLHRKVEENPVRS